MKRQRSDVDDEMDEDAGNDHDAVIEFATYEDFLDSQISTLDLYYLEVNTKMHDEIINLKEVKQL